MVTRREVLISGAAALAGLGTSARARGERRASDPKVPLIHVTDLYHPPQDPDDHFDLATIAALPELDLQGVILDATTRFLQPAPAGFDIPRDPGRIPVTQISRLLRRSIPVAVGPLNPLDHPRDDVSGRSTEEQAGVRLLLELLDASHSPLVISVVGSARVVTAAFNRDPKLVRARVRAVLLNAGSTAGTKREWNVMLDPAAYIGLWRSGLPIDWYPCATEGGAFNQAHERGTYWKATHLQLLAGVSQGLKAWFAYALTGSAEGDSIGILKEEVEEAVWKGLLAEPRNLWATASLVMATGRVLTRNPGTWRFEPPNPETPGDVWPWRLDPIDVQVGEDATVSWQAAGKPTGYRIFGR